MLSYDYMVEDTVWCNDRNIYSKAGFDRNTSVYRTSASNLEEYLNQSFLYKGVERAMSTPSLSCSKNDSFTVSSNNGNGKLTYKVGILTADEAVLAGSVFTELSNSSYLNTGSEWWLMTPALYDLSHNIFVFNVTTNGSLGINSIHSELGVRPVVSLKANAKITSGDGSQNSPYVIEK